MADAPINVFVASTRIESAKVNENFTDIYDELALRLKPVTFSAAPSDGTGTVANNADTRVTLGSEEWDDSGSFTSSRFTPQVAGVWEFTGFVQMVDNLGVECAFQVLLYKNGSRHRVLGYDRATAGDEPQGCGGTALAVANGTTDYFELWAFQDSGSSRRVSSTSYFQGRLVRKEVS